MQLRFAVGTRDGNRSRVWHLKSNRSDVYAFTKGAGSTWKVSMHGARGERSPTCTLAVTGEFAEELRRDGVLQAKVDRFIDQWPRTPLPNGAHLATRLMIPFESVRQRAESLRDDVIWLPPPAENAAIGLSFIFLTPEQGSLALSIPDEQALLARWELDNKEVFLAVAGSWPMSYEASSSLREIRKRARNTSPKWVSRSFDSDEEGLSLITGGLQPDGRHMLVDLDYN